MSTEFLNNNKYFPGNQNFLEYFLAIATENLTSNVLIEGIKFNLIKKINPLPQSMFSIINILYSRTVLFFDSFKLSVYLKNHFPQKTLRLGSLNPKIYFNKRKTKGGHFLRLDNNKKDLDCAFVYVFNLNTSELQCYSLNDFNLILILVD